MKFSVTRHFGQFQFWHLDCEKSSHGGSPMHTPKKLPNNIEEFKCAACGKVGQVALSQVQAGGGQLKEITH